VLPLVPDVAGGNPNWVRQGKKGEKKKKKGDTRSALPLGPIRQDQLLTCAGKKREKKGKTFLLTGNYAIQRGTPAELLGEGERKKGWKILLKIRTSEKGEDCALLIKRNPRSLWTQQRGGKKKRGKKRKGELKRALICLTPAYKERGKKKRRGP